MPQLGNNVLGTAAYCSFFADAAAPAFLANRGFSGFVRNGLGDYSLTMQNPIASTTAGIVTGGLQGAGFGLSIGMTIEVVSTTVLRVRVLAEAPGGAQDMNFWLKVEEIPPA